MGNLAIFFGPRSEVLCSVFVSLKLGVFEWRQPGGGESVRESVCISIGLGIFEWCKSDEGEGMCVRKCVSVSVSPSNSAFVLE